MVATRTRQGVRRSTPASGLAGPSGQIEYGSWPSGSGACWNSAHAWARVSTSSTHSASHSATAVSCVASQ
jgi:hypothetical protein